MERNCSLLKLKPFLQPEQRNPTNNDCILIQNKREVQAT